MQRVLTLLLLISILLITACGDSKAPESSTTRAVSAQSDGATPASSAPAFDLGEGVKEALQVASDRAVDYLTGPEGIGKNEALKIPLPPAVENLRSPLAAIGQEALLERFSETLNESAVEALKVSPQILEETVEKMQLSDVTELWRRGRCILRQDFLTSRRKPLLTGTWIHVAEASGGYLARGKNDPVAHPAAGTAP